MEYLKIKTDVLIIGGGGAGLRAAVAAADCGAQVINGKWESQEQLHSLLLKWQDIMLVISTFPVIPSLIMKIL